MCKWLLLSWFCWLSALNVYDLGQQDLLQKSGVLGGVEKSMSGFRQIGTHLIIELIGCTHEPPQEDFRTALWWAAYVSGSEVLKTQVHSFSPYGMSGFCLLAESHLSIHTWPEFGYVAIDMFTCGDHVDMNKSLAFLVKYFKPERLVYVLLDRGIL